MKTMATQVLSCLLAGSAQLLLAQSGTVATGGEAFGGGLLINYSIGQTDYLVATGSAMEMTQGLQQPYELFTITAAREVAETGASLRVFPNPAWDIVSIQLDKLESNAMDYTLEDTQGRVIVQEKLLALKTDIPMAGLASGVYFIRIVSPGSSLKTFKIIKHS